MPPSPEDFVASLPPAFHDTPYVYERYPGAPGVEGVADGANCQQYAYEILRHFGYDMPPMRSSDLWDDDAATTLVVGIDRAQPLDLILFNTSSDAYGAHVGLYLGDSQVLHLAYSVGKPTVWTMEQFSEDPKCAVVVGIKRPVRRCGAG